MPNTALSEAIKEAYASAPSQQIILHTLELRHPSFVDETGQLVAIRVVPWDLSWICRQWTPCPCQKSP